MSPEVVAFVVALRLLFTLGAGGACALVAGVGCVSCSDARNELVVPLILVALTACVLSGGLRMDGRSGAARWCDAAWIVAATALLVLTLLALARCSWVAVGVFCGALVLEAAQWALERPRAAGGPDRPEGRRR